LCHLLPRRVQPLCTAALPAAQKSVQPTYTDMHAYATALCLNALIRSLRVDVPSAVKECVLSPRIAVPSAAKEYVQPSCTAF
jgi:hypothetical protein